MRALFNSLFGISTLLIVGCSSNQTSSIQEHQTVSGTNDPSPKVAAVSEPEPANTYFNRYSDTRSFMNFMVASLPTEAECKLIFVGEDATKYFQFISQIRKQLLLQVARAEEERVEKVDINAFTYADFETGKVRNSAGQQLASILPKFKQSFTFYETQIKTSPGYSFSDAYRYWVKVDGKWVFLFKPWLAFQN
jgi:hypothetical protein